MATCNVNGVGGGNEPTEIYDLNLKLVSTQLNCLKLSCFDLFSVLSLNLLPVAAAVYSKDILLNLCMLPAAAISWRT